MTDCFVDGDLVNIIVFHSSLVISKLMLWFVNVSMSAEMMFNNVEVESIAACV